jgi:hypothetical protein
MADETQHTLLGQLVSRVRLFVRDLWEELPAVWWTARTRDCERNGGHRWGRAAYNETMQMWGRDCSRCGCWQTTSPTQGTSPFWPNATTAEQLLVEKADVVIEGLERAGPLSASEVLALRDWFDRERCSDD